MKYWRFAALTSLLPILIATNDARAVTYKATLLHPTSGYGRSAGFGVSGNTQVGFGDPAVGDGPHALLWNGTAESVVDLHPTGFTQSIAESNYGNVQVGYGGNDPLFYYNLSNHALLWQGTTESVVDLHPPGFGNTVAKDVWGQIQVGFGKSLTSAYSHALLWNGSAESVIGLHPAGYLESAALAVSPSGQVGGTGGSFGPAHAMLWKGTSESAVDLHPAGYSTSTALGISGDRQVGYGQQLPIAGGDAHALLWSGTAESVIDLNPSWCLTSVAQSISGNLQVGHGFDGSIDRALLWNGTADSVVDLHQFLIDLPITMTRSYAVDIDDNGTIVGNGYDGNFEYAIMWTPVPEPSTWVSIYCGLVGMSLVTRCVRRTR